MENPREVPRPSSSKLAFKLILGVSLGGLLSVASSGQEPTKIPAAERAPPRAILKDTVSIFTLIESQSRSLDAIASRFADLREGVVIVRREFDQAFNAAVTSADAYLLKHLPSEIDWPKYKQDNIIVPASAIDFSKITRQQGQDYIETVRKRTRGEIPEGIYRALVFFHPRYTENPHLELADKYTQQYESKGHKKALGLNIMLLLPKSWAQAEGQRPHILQKFDSPDGLASVMVLVRSVPDSEQGKTDKKILEHLASKEYFESEMLGGKWLSGGSTTIAALSATYSDGLISRNTPAGNVTIRARYYFMIYESKLVSLECDVACTGEHATAEATAEFERYLSLFRLIATGLDILDKYEAR